MVRYHKVGTYRVALVPYCFEEVLNEYLCCMVEKLCRILIERTKQEVMNLEGDLVLRN